MTDDPIDGRRRKRRRSSMSSTEVVEIAVYIGTIYFALHPEKWGELRDLAREWWHKLTHRVSVWQAVRSIRSLPERPE